MDFAMPQRLRGLDVAAFFALVGTVFYSLPLHIVLLIATAVTAIFSGWIPGFEGGLARLIKGKRWRIDVEESDGAVFVLLSLEDLPSEDEADEQKPQEQEEPTAEVSPPEPHEYHELEPAHSYSQFDVDESKADASPETNPTPASAVKRVKRQAPVLGFGNNRGNKFLSKRLLPKPWYYSSDVFDVCDDELRVLAKMADGYSDALHIAAFFGWKNAARCLLDAGFDCNAIQPGGRDLNLLLAEVSQLRSYAAVTPLELAEEQGHDAVVELLKARGARRSEDVPPPSPYVAEAASYIRKMINRGDVGLRIGNKVMSCPIPYLSPDVLESKPYTHYSEYVDFERGEWLKLGPVISSGHFGTVYEAQLHPELRLPLLVGSGAGAIPRRFSVCVKEVRIPANPWKRQMLWNELGMQMLSFTRQQCRLHNPLFVGYSISGDKLWILMRRRDCTLQQFVASSNANGGVVPELLRQVAYDLADQLHHAFHRRNVIHGDIKTDNVLLSTVSGELLTDAIVNDPDALFAEYTDYGLSHAFRTVDDAETEVEPTLHRPDVFFRRTRAPELAPTQAPTTQSDIYAFGILLLDCLLGEALDFTSVRMDTAIAMLHARTSDQRWQAEHAKCLRALVDITERCLSADPRKRPTAQQIQDEMLAAGAARRKPSEFAAGVMLPYNHAAARFRTSRQMKMPRVNRIGATELDALAIRAATTDQPPVRHQLHANILNPVSADPRFFGPPRRRGLPAEAEVEAEAEAETKADEEPEAAADTPGEETLLPRIEF